MCALPYLGASAFTKDGGSPVYSRLPASASGPPRIPSQAEGLEPRRYLPRELDALHRARAGRGSAPGWGGAQSCVLDTHPYNLSSPFLVLSFFGGQYPEVPQITIHGRGVALE